MASLTGTVRWRGTKTAVPDVEIWLLQRKITRHKTHTDKGGRYAIARVKEGTGYTIRATALGTRSAATAPFAITEGTTNRQDIELERSSVSTQTSVTTATTTTSTDTRTHMSTTLTASTDTTTTDTTSTASTISSGTTSTDTSSTATTGTTGTTASTATTATVPPATSFGPPNGRTSFDELIALVAGTSFDPNPAVNIDEARQFRRMYTIANYTLARVPGAVAALNTLLNTSTPPGSAGFVGPASTLPLVSKQALIARHQATIDSVLARASDNTRTESDLLEAARAQFDLGTAAVPNVNVAFKGVFRDFVGLCANDLLAVDPQAVLNQDLSEQQKKEELINFLKRTKRALLRLVENMSMAGTLGSVSLIDKWSRVHKDSIEVLSDVGTFVGSDDADRKHIWSIVAELNRLGKPAIEAYIVHAREGGALLSDAVDAYQQLSTKGELTKEDQAHLRDLFFDSAKYSIGTENISARLRRNALLIQENWIAAWS